MSAATVSQAYLPNTGSAYTQRYEDVRPRANAWRHRFHPRTSKSNRCRTPVRSNGISDKPPGFRDLHPAAEPAGLPGIRPNVELSDQFLLGGRRAAPAARRARVDHAPGDQGQKCENRTRIDAVRQNDHRADNRADDKAELNRTAEHGSNRRVQVLLHSSKTVSAGTTAKAENHRANAATNAKVTIANARH